MRSKYPSPGSPTSFRPVADPAQLRAVARTKRMRMGLYSIGAVGLLTFSMAWNPPVGSIHSFTKASDYRADRDSGCTNSGEGCHGDETEYTNFNDYHPNAECTTCHEYQGVGCIPCHSPDGHECQSCHDGTMEKAGDRTRIVDPYPRGHYRETTHTATATDMKAVLRIAERGEAQATCRACHARDLWASHQKVPEVEGSQYGDSIGCGECHNDTRSAGLAQVKGDWKGRRCEDCHAKKSSSPMHAADVAGSIEPSGTSGCEATGQGCHDVADVHGLHADAPKDCSGTAERGEPTCHDLTAQAHRPTATACGSGEPGGCHLEYENDAIGHDKDADVHSPGPAVAADTSVFGIACGTCHLMADDGTSLLAEHSKPATDGDASCRGCHNADGSLEAVTEGWKSRAGIDACDACHGSDAIDPAHGAQVSAAHVAQDSRNCASTGVGCHDTSDISAAVAGGLHSSCLDCHEEWDQTAKSCGAGASCHTDDGLYTAALNHERGTGRDAMHSAGTAQASLRATDTASGVGYTCGDCHSMALLAEHTRPNSAIRAGGAGTCLACHNASTQTAAVVKDSWPSRPSEWACEACHSEGLSPHTEIGSRHDGVELSPSGIAVAGACTGGAACHKSTDLRVLHVRSGCTTTDCHSASGDIQGRNMPTCGGSDGDAACHSGIHTGVDGYDPSHDAGAAQAEAAFEDPLTGRINACAACHSMVLGTEHVRANSSIATGEGDVCVRCHADSVAAVVVDGDWTARGSADACSACHADTRAAHTAVDTAHVATSLDATGDVSPGSCADGTICHDSTDLRALHEQPGCLTEGCHRATGDIRGRALKTCGGPAGGTACHAGVHWGVNGYDPLHDAGVRQGEASIEETVSGLTIRCLDCHTMILTTEHERPDSQTATGTADVCFRCHEADQSTLDVVDGDWADRDTESACSACHPSSTEREAHTGIGGVHAAAERSLDGTATQGACVTAGCHVTTDVRRLHRAKGCTIEGCHQPSGTVTKAGLMSCGGDDSALACHDGISADAHKQDHSADLTGTVAGITYRPGENVGCFGCHKADLMLEHSQQLLAGSIDGGGSGPCRICHFETDDTGSGDYSAISPVVQAITDGDRRCVACHRSGSSRDTSTGVASPHKVISDQAQLPAGSVWSDPADDWRTALDATTGGGHNALSADAVGANADKAFPLTSFTFGGLTYPWVLPLNSGSTAWLRTVALTPANPAEGPWDAKLFPSATTTEGIQAAMVTCADCHEMGDMSGPQGAAVEIGIDPDYAQTEYANPTPGTYQFDPYNIDIRNGDNPPGYKPVICVKCHLVYARSREGTTVVYVGGNSMHSTHASRHNETCTSCHVRIPHAWKRPRLLPRTVVADGIEPDTFPYVSASYTGLTGIAVTITTRSNPVARDTCTTGGCYSGYYLTQGRVNPETATNHPVAGRDLPADQAYWP